MSITYQIGYNAAMKEMVEAFTSDSYQNQIIYDGIKKMVEEGMPNVYWDAEEIMDYANNLLEGGVK
jgi:hypothetical protein